MSVLSPPRLLHQRPYPRAVAADGACRPRRIGKSFDRVCRGASIGSGAVILCGVTIGAGHSSGGAVVTSDVPAGHVVAGVPARVLYQFDSDATPQMTTRANSPFLSSIFRRKSQYLGRAAAGDRQVASRAEFILGRPSNASSRLRRLSRCPVLRRAEQRHLPRCTCPAGVATWPG